MLLRLFELALIISIVVYGIVLIIKMFSSVDEQKKKANLSNLQEKAKKVAKNKEDILAETEKNKEIIDNITNTLNK
jgi:uncharacterized membrane protein